MNLSLKELPPPPGETPIPEGTVRLFHYTDPNNIDAIRQNGLLANYARGDDGSGQGASAGIWASATPPSNSKAFVEFYAYPEEISNRAQYWMRGDDPLKWFAETQPHSLIMNGSVPSNHIVAIHEPWHSHVRYMLEPGTWEDMVEMNPEFWNPEYAAKLGGAEEQALLYVQKLKSKTAGVKTAVEYLDKITGDCWVLPNGIVVSAWYDGHMSVARAMGYEDYSAAFDAGLIRVSMGVSLTHGGFIETTKPMSDPQVAKNFQKLMGLITPASRFDVTVTTGEGDSYKLWKWNGKRLGERKKQRAFTSKLASSRVVYHGTTVPFDKFNTPAMFHISRRYCEDLIGDDVDGKVIAVKLTINNPADLNALHLSPSDPHFREIAESLAAQGYDGAQYRGQAWVAFFPDQIEVLPSKVAAITLKLKNRHNDKLDQFMANFNSQTTPNPLNQAGRIRNDVEYEATAFDGYVYLNLIRSLDQQRGNGSQGLDWFCALADKYGVSIHLDADQPVGVDGLSQTQLIQWYRRHGFSVARDGSYMVRNPMANKIAATKSFGTPAVEGVIQRDIPATKPEKKPKNAPEPEPEPEPEKADFDFETDYISEEPEEVEMVEVEEEEEPEEPARLVPLVSPEGAPIPEEIPEDEDAKDIATRRPQGATKPGLTDISINMEAINLAEENNPRHTAHNGKVQPGYKDKLAKTLASYTGVKYTKKELKDPDTVIQKFISHVSDNLVWIYEQVGEGIRAQNRRWYDTANQITKEFAKQYNFTHEQVAGTVAALSPQNPWSNNIGLAKRLMDVYRNHTNDPFSPAMDKKLKLFKKVPTQAKAFKQSLDSIRGKSFHELTAPTPDALAAKQALWIRLYDEAHVSNVNDMYAPDGTVVGSDEMLRSWIGLDHMAKAVKILDNGSTENINNVMGYGHKIRNFYNNIINPNSKRGYVTIDTHAVAAAHLSPFGTTDTEAAHNFGNSPRGVPGAPKNNATGLRGTYPVYAEAYQQAAKRLGITPRELQSVIWEGVKSLMGGKGTKTPELKATVKGIWQQVQDGKLTPEDARGMIEEACGGFSKPTWMSQEEWDKHERDKEDASDTSFEF